MLEEKTYSISELAAIIGGSSDRQAIKRKLERRHILYAPHKAALIIDFFQETLNLTI